MICPNCQTQNFILKPRWATCGNCGLTIMRPRTGLVDVNQAHQPPPVSPGLGNFFFTPGNGTA